MTNDTDLNTLGKSVEIEQNTLCLVKMTEF